MDGILTELRGLELGGLYERDFLTAAQRSDQELAGLFAAADALRALREKNYDVTMFRSGVALWVGRQAGRYFSFAAGCAMLGLQVIGTDRADEETLAGAMPDALSAESREEAEALARLAGGLYGRGVLHQRPVTVRLDGGLGFALELIRAFGGVEHLRGKGLAMVPGSREGGETAEVCSRLGLDIRYWGGEALLWEDRERLRTNAARTGGAFRETAAADEALLGAELRWPPEGESGLGHLPYLTAAAVLLAKAPDPVKVLEDIRRRGAARRMV